VTKNASTSSVYPVMLALVYSSVSIESPFDFKSMIGPPKYIKMCYVITTTPHSTVVCNRRAKAWYSLFPGYCAAFFAWFCV